MKHSSQKNRFVIWMIALFLTFASSLFADEPYAPPTYRGKVILIVDQSVLTNSQVSAKIERLTQDLVGDGWRVLRHDVDRGPITPHNESSSYNTAWAQVNAPCVREIRALIKADYNAAPSEAKMVFLIGHIPIPYSGTVGGLNGNHYFAGSAPADTFYGEMTMPYEPGGWSDLATSRTSINGAPWRGQCDNYPGDGMFDQDTLPARMKLAVGRLDLSASEGDLGYFLQYGVDEATLLSRYLDKDHNFRCAVFSVQRRAIVNLYPDTMKTVFGENNVLEIGDQQWFSNVSGSGQDYLLGGVFGSGSGIGVNEIDSSPNGSNPRFVTNDSRVVFVNLRGSWFADWDEDIVLKTPLANPYDPANGRYGYGLTCIWGDPPEGPFYESPGLDLPTLTNRSLGETIGEATFLGNIGYDYRSLSVNIGLMGDPTLRMHSVLPVANLTAIVTDTTTVTLSWTASADATEGYNIYSAPTRNGPFVLFNTAGPVNDITYDATRPTTGDPDNFYMVRAVKLETTPVGSYTNMSEGVVASLPDNLTSYLNILSGPVNQSVIANTGGGIANSAAFSVDAVGVEADGNEQISYQWYKGDMELPDNGHYSGVNTSGLLIKGVQTGDAGNYWVEVSNNGGSSSLPSSPATLTVYPSNPTTAGNDTVEAVCNTPTDFNDLLANDSTSVPGATLSLVSISALSPSNAGIITINSDHRTIHFIPSMCYYGTATFIYTVSDGVGTAQATVTVTFLARSGDNLTVSAIGTQQMTQDQDTTLDVPFTVNDSFTSPDDLTYVARCSNRTLIPDGNFSVTGVGNDRILHIKAGTHQFGSSTITLTVTDCDGVANTQSFPVTINVADIPTLIPFGVYPQYPTDGFFHFNVIGPNNCPIQIMKSDDLVTWISLGNVTLSGNPYPYDDTTSGSSTHRFYRAIVVGGDGCSINTIGFIQVTVPGRNSDGSGGYAYIANQLNHFTGQTYNNTYGVILADTSIPPNPPTIPTGTTVAKFDYVSWSMGLIATYPGRSGGGWADQNIALNPGEGAWIRNPSNTSFKVTFVGDVPQGQQVNSHMPTAGKASLISSIIPRSGTLDALGFQAVNGDQIQQWNVGSQQLVTTATYTGGAWSPAVPSVAIGESFFVQSSSSISSRPSWTENFSGCLPVTMFMPTNGSVLVNPPVIVLIANATAVAGIRQVEFFQGNTSLGVATHSGSFYIRSWNNPLAGIYSLTAVATDNNSATTTSPAVIVNVLTTPTGLTATPGDRLVALRWSATGGATSYNIKRSISSGGPYTVIASQAGTVYTDTGLANGTTYYYVVSAVNSGVESPNSGQVSAIPLPPPPQTPTSLTATPGDGLVALSWSASSGATSYNVKRSTASGGHYTVIANRVWTACTDTGLADGTTYYYVVSAVNSGGESANSSPVSATPQPPPCDPAPSGLVAWWQAEGNANDIVNGNNGTLVGGVGFDTGKVGQAFSFNTYDAGITVPASPSLTNVGIGAGLTLECWIYPTAVNNMQWIMGWKTSNGYGVHLKLSQPAGSGQGPGCLMGNVMDVTYRLHTLSSAAGIVQNNVFQHVALTYDNASRVATIYLNGEIVAQQALNTTGMLAGPFTPQTTYPFVIGQAGGPRPDYPFSGLMDEVGVYNRVLTTSEIQAIYAAGSAGKCSP